jgi:MFS family permease
MESIQILNLNIGQCILFWYLCIYIYLNIKKIGMVFGSLISGKIADRRGRRVCMMFSCILQFITAVSFSLMWGPV